MHWNLPWELLALDILNAKRKVNMQCVLKQSLVSTSHGAVMADGSDDECALIIHKMIINALHRIINSCYFHIAYYCLMHIAYFERWMHV